MTVPANEHPPFFGPWAEESKRAARREKSCNGDLRNFGGRNGRKRSLKEKLTTFLDSNELLCKEQNGFTRGRSCLTNLPESLENWAEALDGFGLDIVYPDYSKAFDSVPHRKLLEKLKSFGLIRKLIKWLDSFYVPQLC